MNTLSVIRPTDFEFYAEHTEEALRSIIDSKTADSLHMFLNGAEGLAMEAMKIANAAWAELTRRGLA